MAITSGFFNSIQAEGVDDRLYNADDYCSNLAAIISNGVRRSGDDELKITATGGMSLSMAAGRAWIEGHWIYNDAPYSLTVPTSPTGSNSRIDRVVLRLGSNQTTSPDRSVVVSYKEGTPAQSPVAPTLERNNGVYEIAIADIRVSPNVTSISALNITDQRGNKDVCGWITTPIGYDDYFASMDNAFQAFFAASTSEFDAWFAEKRDTLASVTMYKRYCWSTEVVEATQKVSFAIPQYDPTGVDVIDVFVNGKNFTPEKDFTLTDNIITFTTSLQSGDIVTVYCYKSIDGTGLGSVSDEVTKLQNQIDGKLECDYVCNGLTDNIELSNLAQEFFASEIANEKYGMAQMYVRVHGNFGATTPYAGEGTVSTRYRWMSLGYAGDTDRRIIFDFSDCSPVNFDLTAGKRYIGIFGRNVIVKGGTFTVTGGAAPDTGFVMFADVTEKLQVDDCQFYLTGYDTTFIAQSGTFNNCKGTVLCLGTAACFKVHNNGVLVINGGEYCAYKLSTSAQTVGAVALYDDSNGGKLLANGVKLPKKDIPNYKQGYSAYLKKGSANLGQAFLTSCVFGLNYSIQTGDKPVWGTAEIIYPMFYSTFPGYGG